ncbi:MAG: EamA family transporter, partial [Rubrobacteraceae bacterium]|nr:EamA family transporter [Rubrobacteraceae bacterium]
MQKDLVAEPAKRSRGIPPTGLVLFSIGSVQLGAAIAKGLFDSVGPGGTVLFRISLSALVLLLLWRPKLGGYARAEYGLAVVFGLALAAMNLSLYLAIDR